MNDKLTVIHYFDTSTLPKYCVQQINSSRLYLNIMLEKFKESRNERTNLELYSLTFLKHLNVYRSSSPEVFCEKGVLRNFGKLTGKHLCQSLFFSKVAGGRLQIY